MFVETLLAAWPFIILASVLIGFFLDLKGKEIVGDPALMNDPFRAPPGGVYFESTASGYHDKYVLENFIVSIASTTLPDFVIDITVRARLSKGRLEGYSDRLFDEVFESHRPMMGKFSLPDTWGRPEKTAILVSLSSVPVHSGRLECREGRLVLRAQRMLDRDAMPRQTPESLLTGAKAALECFDEFANPPPGDGG